MHAWMTYVEEVQLIWIRGSNACCEQQKVALQPFDLEGRELKADTGTCFVTHVEIKVVQCFWIVYDTKFQAPNCDFEVV